MIKKKLAEINKCYATAPLQAGGRPYIVFAAEGDGSVHIFSGEDFETHEVLTEGGGGTMSIVPIPGADGSFLLSRGFYSMVDSKDSTIEIVRFRAGRFQPPVVVGRIPYLHRFGIVTAPDGRMYIVAASLHSFKKDKEDWSHPGFVYTAPFPAECDKDFSLEFLQMDGEYYMNHGFCTASIGGREAAFTTSKEGAFAWFPPHEGSGWIRRQLLSFPASDIAVSDIDGDGHEELAILSPFHGNRCSVFHETEGGYSEIYTSPEDNDFYHAIYAARIDGAPVFIGGARKGVQDLFTLRWENGIVLEQLDTGVGPSNVCALNTENGDYILSANRMVGEAAVYFRA